MEFVYAYACQSSPVKNLQPEKRVLRCLELIKDRLDNKQMMAYAKLNFPDKIQSAIDRMAKFDLGARMRAKAIIEKVFSKVEQIAETEFDTPDIESMKRYIDLAKGVAAIMPNLVFQMENGYGVKYVAPVEEEEQDTKVTWESIVGSKA